MDDITPLDAALERTIAGDPSPADRALVSAWAAGNDQRRRWLAALRALAGSSVTDWSTEERLAVLRETTVAPPVSPARFPAHSPAFRRLAALAAGLVLLVGGAAIVHQLRQVPRDRDVATGMGEHRLIPLRDGSEVVLGPNSRIRIGQDDRRAELMGLAHFTIRHDPSRAFVVVAGNAVATDLGTEFTVRAYPQDSTVEVAVADGLVSLSAQDSESKPVELRPGYVGSLNQPGTVRVTREMPLAPYVAWKDSSLAFTDQPLTDVLHALERRFRVRFALEDTTLAARRVTAIYPYPNIADITRSLTEVLGVHFSRAGNVITVRAGQ